MFVSLCDGKATVITLQGWGLVGWKWRRFLISWNARASRVPSPCLGVDSGSAGAAGSSVPKYFTYLFMLILDNKENKKPGLSVLPWASCWLVYAFSSHRFVCCHSFHFLSVFKSRTGGLYGDRHQFYSVH